MHTRRVVLDNIATPGAPVYRARYATPLTPRAVRDEIIAMAMDEHESARDAWIQARLTPLDRMVTTEEADALESYALCTQILAGSARCGDYTGDRVQTSRMEMSPLPDKWMADLARHDVVRRGLSAIDRQMLATFCDQMDCGGISDAEAAIVYQLPGHDRRMAWAHALSGAAGRLVRG